MLKEDLREGSSVFRVTAAVPVVESWDFPDEIRNKTSGLALPQLFFSHWEVSFLFSPIGRKQMPFTLVKTLVDR